MNDVDLVRALVAYNRSVFERFERSIARRPWRAATADRGIGHGSLKDTLVHILNVQEAWLVAVAQEKWEVFDAPCSRGPRSGPGRSSGSTATRSGRGPTGCCGASRNAVSARA